MPSILAADIGATNSRFAHFQVDKDDALTLIGTTWLPTAGAGSFVGLLEQVRAQGFSLPFGRADIAVIAVAGPVERGAYTAPPYISWDIDLAGAECRALLPKAALINDFVAQAYACRSLPGKAARPIIAGQAADDAAIAVVGAGSNLGKAYLAPVPGMGFLAMPSEGGHACFPFVSEEEFAFQRFYQEKSGQARITGNLVVSGKGLRHIHWFLTGEDLEPQQVAARFAGKDGAKTLAWAAKFYGRICREYALEVLARGGLYIAGGVAARNPEIIDHGNFRTEFADSPTMGHILARIPVFLMDNQESGLWGAAFHGMQLLRKG